MSIENAGGVLLLSHVGFSFMEDLVATVRARGLRIYVLSSLPEPRHQRSRPGALADLADDLRVTAGHVLTWQDVEDYLGHLCGAGEQVLCCLTVWEGYRHLMALANGQLGVPDLEEKQVLVLRDKLTLRNRLADGGLSRGRAVELTPRTLREYRQREARYFVKPVSGIASFGAFPLGPETTWADVVRVIAEARADTIYASAFGDGVDFLIEDYLTGPEFSFEVIVVSGEPYVVAIHEKVEVTEAAGTVLENCCVSPPRSLSAEDRAAGICWMASVLALLGLRWGCFHIEARHTPYGWDLVEINPRVGGSLISASVAELTSGPSMLDLWLDSLLTADQPTGFRKALRGLSYGADGSTPKGLPCTADGSAPVESATFFRVFFADPGTIRWIGTNDDLPLQPVVSQILLKPGDVVESSSREVFLGQLLWRMDRADQDRILPGLLRSSSTAIEVGYETENR